MPDAEPRLFISHSHSDAALANALNAAVTRLLDNRVAVFYSTKRGDGGIPVGSDWLRWIGEQVGTSEYTVLLLTRNFLAKPAWLLWEAGAVYGAALTASEGRLLPLRFLIGANDLPSPLASSNLQTASGEQRDEMKSFFNRLIEVYCEHDVHLASSAGQRLNEVADDYVTAVQVALGQPQPSTPPSEPHAETIKKALEVAILGMQAFRPSLKANGRYFYASVDKAGNDILIRSEKIYCETIPFKAEFTLNVVDVTTNADTIVVCRSFLDRQPVYKALTPELWDSYSPELRKNISKDQGWVLACPVVLEGRPVGVICLYGVTPPAKDANEVNRLESMVWRVSELCQMALSFRVA